MTSKQKIKKSSLQADSQKKTVNKALSLFYLLLRISVIGILIAQFFNGNFENVMLCVLTLILFAIPPLIERRLKIEIPDTLEVIILLSMPPKSSERSVPIILRFRLGTRCFIRSTVFSALPSVFR